MRNRYYDSTTGRFISEDPVKDGLNWYSYCGGNPVAFVDPSGLDAVVLLNPESVEIGSTGITLGHMAILVQDVNGQWYYFSSGREVQNE